MVTLYWDVVALYSLSWVIWALVKFLCRVQNSRHFLFTCTLKRRSWACLLRKLLTASSNLTNKKQKFFFPAGWLMISKFLSDEITFKNREHVFHMTLTTVVGHS